MDDMIQTYPSEDEACRSAEEIKVVLHTGGFNLTESDLMWQSNKPVALENLLEEDRSRMKTQRILVQTWDPKTDKFMFAKPKLLYIGEQLTQRKVLSIAVCLFDQVGLISPFVIRSRCILQKIIKEGRNWDQHVSECYKEELKEWMDQFDSMTSIQIPRCLIPNTNGTHQLHTFTNASMSAIVAIVSVKITNADGPSTSRYVISKTIGTDQAAEHFRTEIGSSKTCSRASRFRWEREGNYHKFKTILDRQHPYTWIDPIQPKTDVHCQQLEQNSREFQPGQLETHPGKDESRWPRHTRPHSIRHTKAVVSTTGLSEHT